MRLNYVIALTVLLFRVRVQALVAVDSTLASACLYYEMQYQWGCTQLDTHDVHETEYGCRCKKPAWLGSIVECIYQGSSVPRLREHALRHVADRCSVLGYVHHSVDDFKAFYENATDYFRDTTSDDLTVLVNEPLRVNKTSYSWYYKSFKDYTFAAQRSQWFGWGLVLYWAAVLALASFFNVLKRCFGFRLETNYIRRILTLPAIVGKHHRTPYVWFRYLQIYFPTRLQSLVITVFLIQTVLSASVGYNGVLHYPHPYLASRWFMNMDMISYRTDLMSVSLFPVVYMFGIRNNIFIRITGISFATFNLYHKWTGYVMVILAFIHSIIWTVWARSDVGGGYSGWWKDLYWQYGVFATMLLFLLVFHSFKALRDASYEFFLALHLLFNVAFIVCMYYHMNVLGWMGWIWSMVAILAFDRAARIAKIVLCGGLQSATVVDCGDGVVKMRIKRPRHVRFAPGSYAFIYFFSKSDPWIYLFQSHPFTVMCIPEEDASSLTIIFKAEKGITRNVLRRLLGKPQMRYNVFVEGPYGGELPCYRHSTRRLVGLAAGLGITAVYPHLRAAVLAELATAHVDLDYKEESFTW